MSFSNVSKLKGKLTGRRLVLLDTGATDQIICNSALISDIEPALAKKTVITNAGKMVIDKKGLFPGIGEVYYHPSAVINVLSLGMIEAQPKRFDVGHVQGSHFTVKNETNGKIMRLALKRGLFLATVACVRILVTMLPPMC